MQLSIKICIHYCDEDNITTTMLYVAKYWMGKTSAVCSPETIGELSAAGYNYCFKIIVERIGET